MLVYWHLKGTPKNCVQKTIKINKRMLPTNSHKKHPNSLRFGRDGGRHGADSQVSCEAGRVTRILLKLEEEWLVLIVHQVDCFHCLMSCTYRNIHINTLLSRSLELEGCVSHEHLYHLGLDY